MPHTAVCVLKMNLLPPSQGQKHQYASPREQCHKPEDFVVSRVRNSNPKTQEIMMVKKYIYCFAHHQGTLGTGGTASPILNLRNTTKQVVNFKPQPFYQYETYPVPKE